MKTLHMTTTVQPGNRVELIVPELREGELVEVVMTQREAILPRRHLIDLISELSLPTRSLEEWGEIERDFQRERDAWDL